MPHRSTWLRRGAAALVTGLALTLAAVAPASAHDELVSTTPANGATVATPPTSITLTFAEPPLDSGLALTVTGAGGAPTVLAPSVSGNDVVATVPTTLTAGQYKVAWRVVADDGHPITGSFAFTVGASTATPTPSPTATSASPSASATSTPAPAGSGQSPLPWVVIGLVALAAIGVVVVRVTGRRGA